MCDGTDWLIDIMLHMFFGTFPITFPMSSCTVTAHLPYLLLDSGTHVKMLWIPAWDLLKWWYLQNKRWRWKTKCIISIPKTITNVKSVVSGTGNLWGGGIPYMFTYPLIEEKKTTGTFLSWSHAFSARRACICLSHCIFVSIFKENFKLYVLVLD